MNTELSPIIGIDLGTTNSVVATLIDGKIEVLSEDGEAILPSIVGLTLDNKLIVGQAAKNQLAAFPERTISSVKRRMGESVQLSLGDQKFSPQEISAMILRRLKQRAETRLGCEVTRAVITVPAFFDENQRQATREAGALAGLQVERIINEPTAASLVYHAGTPERKHLIVYDLGGGTFDVSIVRIEDGVVEVLSSKGDTRLGGDDFDELLAKHVAAEFSNAYTFDLLEHSSTRWRLMQACERAKCELSTASSVRISEEFIATINGESVSLDVTVGRDEYERLIASLVQRTIECVDEAIRDSGLTMSQLDELILVGGSTRTPLVQRLLREEFHREPKWSVNPDLAVALGAGTQGAMQAGHAVGPVLIDVATHTLGIEALSTDSYDSNPKLVYARLLVRNSPLPCRFEDIFRTVTPDQSVVEINVYQGESDELTHNTLIGTLRLEGLNASSTADGFILVRFELTLDGILKVTAIERASGIAQSLQIHNALRTNQSMTHEESQERLTNVFNQSEGFRAWVASSAADTSDGEEIEVTEFSRMDSGAETSKQPKLNQLINKAKQLRPSLVGDDAEDVDRLLEQIERAMQDEQIEFLPGLEDELDDLLFYLQ
ncbi:MAG: Hsp70 family protein [Pirellulaceae bacterium]|nr:Hsp70 family protein [Pirellulaceae bacterium]